MRRVGLIVAVVFIAAASLAAQETAGSHQRGSISTGDRTIVGCVAMGAPGYVLNTPDGTTMPLRSMMDLAPYVGKKVEIHATWTATGVNVAGPIESSSTSAPAPAQGGTQTAQAFAGDIHLKLNGRVIGDCLGKK